jgi:hypothetical protein
VRGSSEGDCPLQHCPIGARDRQLQRLGLPHQLVWIGPYRPANLHELSGIEPPFAQFDFRHERLSLANSSAKLNLGDAGILSSLDEKLDHPLVEVGPK